MTSSLVGSEMCIRDRKVLEQSGFCHDRRRWRDLDSAKFLTCSCIERKCNCLLYTSDAADDM
eukprot:5370887-Prorocentrum_lima.AAC.1